jgi:antitoxin component of MazEF toxin-antitoxin module
MRKKLNERNIRKVFKKGASLAITLPKEITRELKIRKGQKLVVKKYGSKLLVSDWKKSILK